MSTTVNTSNTAAFNNASLNNTNTNINTKLDSSKLSTEQHQQHDAALLHHNTNMNKAPLGAQPGFIGKEEAKLVLADEELVIGKRKVSAGSVQVDKRVETQTVSVPVSLKHEEALIERRPIKTDDAALLHGTTGTTTTGLSSSSHLTGHAFQPETIKITTTAEQAIATKAVVPKEEIHLSKTHVSETKRINETVRKEHAEVHNNLTAIPDIQIKQQQMAGASGAHHTGAVASHLDANGGRVVAFEEKLGVGKQVVPTGEVSVTKRVETAPATATVGLSHDELKVDRRAISGTGLTGSSTGAFDTSSAFQGNASTRIKLTAEEAVVGKRVVPKEEVVLRKKEEVSQKAVQTQLRSERVDIAPTTTTTTATTTTGAINTTTGINKNTNLLASSSASSSSFSSAPMSTSSSSASSTTTTGAPATAMLFKKL